VIKFFHTLIYIILFMVTTNCNNKNSNHYEYWEQYFSAHNEIRNSSFMGSEYEILFGGLSPEKEAIMKKNTDGDLYLTTSISKRGDKYFKNTESDIYPTKDDILHIHTKYTLKQINTKETYLIRRTSHFTGKEFSVIDFIDWYFFFLNNWNDETIKKSSTYNTFCRYYICNLSISDTNLIFLFSPNNKLKDSDISQYTRMKKFLELTKIDLKINSPSGEIIFSLSNTKDNFIIEIPKLKTSEKFGNFQIITSIYLDYYGLKINLTDIGYQFLVEKKQKLISLKGNYNIYPKILISGRLWHILPPGLLDIFIPGNMNDYFKGYFDMLFKGSSGLGSFIEITSVVSQNKVDMVIINQSESYRKPFRIFGNPPKREKSPSSFTIEFEKSVLEDLK
jgi:hypothetical protein